jgi:hypothetical protein
MIFADYRVDEMNLKALDLGEPSILYILKVILSH